MIGINFLIHSVKQIPNGFRLIFTQKLDEKTASEASNYLVKKYRFDYNSKYGSPRKNEQKLKASKISLSPDGMSLEITFPELSQGHVYQFELDKLKSAKGQNLASSLFCYNLIEVIK